MTRRGEYYLRGVLLVRGVRLPARECWVQKYSFFEKEETSHG
jgi:hypothetical protein